MSLVRLFHTVRYLKFSQIFFRISRRLIKPSIKSIPQLKPSDKGNWDVFTYTQPSLFSSGYARFLNKEQSIESATIWNEPSIEKLWLYNLHYFDDINAVDSEKRTEIHTNLINRWIVENPVSAGNGWEPYTLSLRIVNWIKGLLTHLPEEKQLLQSLATQTEYLSQSLEFHILGNHLLANVKALIFAGTFFEGPQAQAWLVKGTDIILAQLDEQILEDGAHFELSPMYHCIVLVDLLDLINLSQAYDNKMDEHLVRKLRVKACAMLNWLNAMLLGDRQISFFNDAAFGIAAQPEQIFVYAKQLKLPYTKPKSTLLTTLSSSGYSRLAFPRHVAIFDHAKVGPDYLPGHAHADSLSLEWSIKAQRVLVNSGTSVYGVSRERLRQKQTAAHNTLVVDGRDSSEVWSGFRVARRAACRLLESKATSHKVSILASHNGYSHFFKKCDHLRRVEATENTLTISDELEGEWTEARVIFHLHPRVFVSRRTQNSLTLTLCDDTEVVMNSQNYIGVEESTWHPEFGQSVPNKKLCISFTRNSSLVTKFTF